MVVKSGERFANARLAASRLTTAFSLAFARLIQTPLRSEGVRSRDVHFGPFCFFVVGLLAVWVWKFERLSLNAARFPTRWEPKTKATALMKEKGAVCEFVRVELAKRHGGVS